MKNLSRILTVCLCCIPAFSAGGAPVATTSGNNLTAYNPSNAYNNQWATMTNGRYDDNPTAKVDFGNCNAVILRCAQPKCGNGGCLDPAVAKPIVEGCIKTNTKCKQYGDELVDFMVAQLMASSNAKINQQEMALEQAKIQAEAQASAANAQSEKITQMQNQMVQMQQQMAQQQQESAQKLQEALAQQAAQSQSAINDMKNAATAAAKETEAGITAYEQDAINRGVATEVLERKKITGQIMTEIENAEVSLKEIKTAMLSSFEYAGCDTRGDNCTGPKRIKKWRELAIGFFDPYDNAIDKIYDAIIDAQAVGVDLSDIYMMLSNSCNRWGQYLCEKGANIDYSGNVPRSCPLAWSAECYARAKQDGTNSVLLPQFAINNAVYQDCLKEKCHDCKLIQTLNDREKVLEDWVNTDVTDTDNGIVIHCASQVLDNTPIFARRTRNKRGAGLVDIEFLEKWLVQKEPSNARPSECSDDGTKCSNNYCKVDSSADVDKQALEQATSKKSVFNIPGVNFCVSKLGSNDRETSSEDCTYINHIFGICDTHPYNVGESSPQTNADDIAEMREIIGLKVTAASQQMYKQYEYINATFKRLKMHLEKSVLTANLEAAGAKSNGENSTDSGRNSTDKTIHLSGAMNCSAIGDMKLALDCVSNNTNLISTFVSSQKKNACLQLQETVSTLASVSKLIGNAQVGELTFPGGNKDNPEPCTKYNVHNTKQCADSNKDNINSCINDLRNATMRAKNILENEQNYNKYGRW